jgi:hypothetical protein
MVGPVRGGFERRSGQRAGEVCREPPSLSALLAVLPGKAQLPANRRVIRHHQSQAAAYPRPRRPGRCRGLLPAERYLYHRRKTTDLATMAEPTEHPHPAGNMASRSSKVSSLVTISAPGRLVLERRTSAGPTSLADVSQRRRAAMLITTAQRDARARFRISWRLCTGSHQR